MATLKLGVMASLPEGPEVEFKKARELGLPTVPIATGKGVKGPAGAAAVCTAVFRLRVEAGFAGAGAAAAAPTSGCSALAALD